MVQHTHRASAASPHNAAEALGTEEVVGGSIGSHKGRQWHCNVGRHPAGLCALVGHFHLCSLSWQVVTCQHCPKPCCTLRADRQQRAQLAAGPPFQERVLFLLLLFGPLCCSNKNLYNWAIHLKKKNKQTCIFSFSEAGKAKSSIVCAVSAKAFRKLRVLCSNVGQAPSSRTLTGSMNLLMRMQFS